MFTSKNPDPKIAALMKIARGYLRVSLTEVGVGVGRDWSTVSNVERGYCRAAPNTEEKIFRFYLQEIQRRGVATRSVPDGAPLRELHVALAQALVSFQALEASLRSEELSSAAEGTLELGSQDMVDRLIERGLNQINKSTAVCGLLDKIAKLEADDAAR